jgi:purine nucleosidase
MNKLILDVDTGEDDALAVLLAVKNKLPLTHVVTSFGNTSLENSTRNTARLLDLVKAKKVKVVKGSSKPLQEHPFEKTTSVAGDFVGKNGLCNVELPDNENIIIEEPSEKDFVKHMEAIFKKNGKSDYIITGPCTNFARVCIKLGKKIHAYIENVYIMGGAIHTPGNSGPLDPKTKQALAEFNAYCDPHALEVVLQTGLPIHMITWDITSTVTIPFKAIKKFKSTSPEGKFVITLMQSFFSFYGLSNDRNFELNDPLTVMAYMGRGTYTDEKIAVVTTEKNYGQTKASKTGYPIKYYQIENIQPAIQEILEMLTVHSS